MRNKALISLLLLLSLSQICTAQSQFKRLEQGFVGIGLGSLNSNTKDDTGDNISFTAAELIAGYKMNSYLGVDVRIGASIGAEDFVDAGTVEEIKISNYYSIYWRPESANEDSKAYGLIGYSGVNMEIGSESGSDSGLSYGGGVGFTLKEDWNLNFEYRWLLDTDLAEFSIFSMSVDRRF